MLFHEIYSCYFNTVAKILKKAVDKKLTKKQILDIVKEEAFGESMMTIPDALRKMEWPFLTEELKTPIKYSPTQPLTLLQKRWLKAILQDKRIALFEPDVSELEKMDIEPLYTPDMFVYYDQYQDGDPYDDLRYRQHFKTIRNAFRTDTSLYVKFIGKTGLEHEVYGKPENLEYSTKDDKFRLFLDTSGNDIYPKTEINLARILDCSEWKESSKVSKALKSLEGAEGLEKSKNLEMEKKEQREEEKEEELERRFLSVIITDERNALNRAMLQFSYLQKETTRIDEIHYSMVIYYDKNDETEILIQILSFGPFLQVVEPEDFKDKLKTRIQRQVKILK